MLHDEIQDLCIDKILELRELSAHHSIYISVAGVKENSSFKIVISMYMS